MQPDIMALAKALGDDPANPQYVQTVARRGYRFISPVQPIVSAATTVAGTQANSSRSAAAISR